MLRLNARTFIKFFEFLGGRLIEGGVYYIFITQDPENKIKAVITGKRQREVGLVVPAKFIFTTRNKRYSEVLEKELLKRKTKFPSVTLKFKQKGVYRQFPYFYTK